MSKKKGQSSRREDVKTEEPLQAVVLADSFTRTFRPITFEKPKALLPLVNIPMLEYPIEVLASSGVKEVIVFCVSHAEEIEAFLKTSRCSKIVNLRCITSSACLSAGDAIRELDRMHVVRSDPFILISGNVISNMNLAKAIEEHKERKKLDSSSLMTMIFKNANVNHPIKPLVGDLVVAMDNRTNQVIMYDDNDDESSVVMPTVFLQEHAEITMRYDLLDCHIDICSPEVLVQFSDNFDYLDIRRDFVHNEAQNFELGHKIFCKIITDEYAAPVHDPRTYDAVSRDIIRRWTYPMVPDNNILGCTTYTYQRGGIYKEDEVTLARSCIVGEHTVIGSGTSIDQNSKISTSVLGRNCKIGKDVDISGSYVWDDVTVEDGAKITNAIICDGVIIGRNVVVERGCILSFGVVIGEGFTVKEFTCMTKNVTEIEGDDFDDHSNIDNTQSRDIGRQWDPTDVGSGGVGRTWLVEEEDDESDPSERRKKMIGAIEEQKEREKLWDDWENLSDDEDIYSFDKETPQEYFARVVRDMVLSGDRQGHSVVHILLEIKSFKFAQNRTFSDCIHAIIPALIDSESCESNAPMERLKKILPKLDEWGKLLTKWIMGNAEEIAVIQAIAQHVSKSENKDQLSPLFRYLLQRVYDLELASEEVIISWANTIEEAPLKELVQTPAVQEFIEWLSCDDDDEDEDSDEESD